MLSELLIKFLKYEEARTAIARFLADKNVSTFKAKARVLAGIAVLIKQRP